MLIHVARTLYFGGERGGRLTFTEDSPAVEHTDHQVCGCTKHVKERPAGEPESRTHRFRVLGEVGRFRTEFCLSTLWFTVRWGEDPRAHTYYRFKPGERSCIIEHVVREPDWSSAESRSRDLFFANLYMGNRINTGSFRNGGMPSQIVDLATIKPGQIWLHSGRGGPGERMSFFPDGDSQEAHLWRETFDRVELLNEHVRPHREDFTSTVDQVRTSMTADSVLTESVSWLQHRLSSFTDSIEGSTLRKLARELDPLV